MTMTMKESLKRTGFRPGTAMVEFVLTVPLLASVLGLTFFFGWVMMHKHQVVVADRYAAWSRVEAGAWPGTDDLNIRCFAGEADGVYLDTLEGVTETVDELVGLSAARSPRTGALADRLLDEWFPGGQRAQVGASWNTSQPLWQQFVGRIKHQHGREGITWRRDEVSPWNTLRDEYYSDMDTSLKSKGNMGQMIQGLYLAHW